MYRETYAGKCMQRDAYCTRDIVCLHRIHDTRNVQNSHCQYKVHETHLSMGNASQLLLELSTPNFACEYQKKLIPYDSIDKFRIKVIPFIFAAR